MNMIEELAEEIKKQPDYKKWKRRPKWLNFLVLNLFYTPMFHRAGHSDWILFEAFREADLI